MPAEPRNRRHPCMNQISDHAEGRTDQQHVRSTEGDQRCHDVLPVRPSPLVRVGDGCDTAGKRDVRAEHRTERDVAEERGRGIPEDAGRSDQHGQPTEDERLQRTYRRAEKAAGRGSDQPEQINLHLQVLSGGRYGSERHGHLRARCRPHRRVIRRRTVRTASLHVRCGDCSGACNVSRPAPELTAQPDCRRRNASGVPERLRGRADVALTTGPVDPDELQPHCNCCAPSGRGPLSTGKPKGPRR